MNICREKVGTVKNGRADDAKTEPKGAIQVITVFMNRNERELGRGI